MDFSDQIKQFSKKVAQLKDKCTNEAVTKLSLINPFLRLLGYDTADPHEVFPEFVADIGDKKGEKVDYAIMNDNDEPIILIEAKCCGEDLTSCNYNQLLRYFHGTSAKFGILTNGIVYKFYTDLDEANKLDKTPFLEFDILDLRDNAIFEIKKFRKDTFDVENVLSTASELKYSKAIKDYFSEQLKHPQEDFIRYVLSNIYSGRAMPSVVEKFTPIIKKSLNDLINELMTDKISAALKSNGEEVAENAPELSVPTEESNQTELTAEELEIFYAIRTLLCRNIPYSDVTYRIKKSCINILHQDNQRKLICRFMVKGLNKRLEILDENKNPIKVELANGLSDLYQYENNLLKVLSRYIS